MLIVYVFNVNLPYVFSVMHEIPNAGYFTLIKHDGSGCTCRQFNVIASIIRHLFGRLMKKKAIITLTQQVF